jgi:hypothetical protein
MCRSTKLSMIYKDMTPINLAKTDLQYQILGWGLFLHSRSARKIWRHDEMKEW